MGVNKTLIALYVIGCIHHSVASIYSLLGLDFSGITDEKLLDIKVHSFRYLTSWNLLIQTCYFYHALSCEIMPLIQNKTISKLLALAKISKGTFFSGIIFPSTICVSTVFWTLHLINNEYIFPPGYEKVLPIWLNHCIHTNILYLLIVELALGQLYLPRYFITYTLSIIYTVIYTIQFLALHYETGRWLYGILYFLDYTQQIVFISFINIYFVILTFIGVLIVRRKSNKFVLTEQEKRKLCVGKVL